MLHLTAQCSQTSTAVRATSEPRLVRQIPRQGSVREPVSTAPESRLYTTASNARLLTMETHPVTSAHCCWARLKPTWSLEVCSNCRPRHTVHLGIFLPLWCYEVHANPKKKCKQVIKRKMTWERLSSRYRTQRSWEISWADPYDHFDVRKHIFSVFVTFSVCSIFITEKFRITWSSYSFVRASWQMFLCLIRQRYFVCSFLLNFQYCTVTLSFSVLYLYVL